MNITDSKLETEKDKAGVDIDLYYCQRLGDTPNMLYFLSNFVKMIQQGHVVSHLVGNNKCKAIYAVAYDQIIGQITFDTLDDYAKTTWIHSAVVEEGYRNRGVYKMMYRQLEQLMPQIGSRKVAGHVHVTNTDGLESTKKMGLVPIYYRMEKNI